MKQKNQKYKSQKNLSFLKRDYNKQPKLHYGSAGLVALESNRISDKQLSAVRLALSKFLKKRGKVWVHLNPSISVTKKPSETRMGKGKGSIDYYCSKVRKNKVILEIGNVPIDLAESALKVIQPKFPIKTKILSLSYNDL